MSRGEEARELAGELDEMARLKCHEIGSRGLEDLEAAAALLRKQAKHLEECQQLLRGCLVHLPPSQLRTTVDSVVKGRFVKLNP